MAIDPITRAMTSRIETIYNLPQLGLFFMTGQPSGEQRFDGLGERKASIAICPYITLTQEERADFTAKSENIETSKVDVLVNNASRKIDFYDRLTKVTSSFSFDMLDSAVRTRLDLPAQTPKLGL